MIDFTELKYSKTPEQEKEEQLMAATARCYLESLGIQVSTKYGYYRDTYDIMRDFGKWLSENNKYTLPADYLISAIKLEEI